MLDKIKTLFSKPNKRTTHDYTNGRWGHDCYTSKIINDGQTLVLMGFGRGIVKGDYIILPNENRTTRYQVKEISYMCDPSDMWKMTARFAPRKQGEV